jgi:tRNA dimethylallyltransferase
MKNSLKIISVVGQTATGKTDKSFLLAELWCKKDKKNKAIIVSADSKQVYKDLKILSGADIPNDFIKKDNHYLHPTLPISLYGISNIDGKEEWSVGHFYRLVKELIKNHKHEKTLFIMVGGTGLYHQQAYKPSETLNVKPDFELRKSLEDKTVEELQNILIEKNKDRLLSMNNSDKNNPRRLIRAIEVGIMKTNNQDNISPIIQVGLTTENVDEKIRQRVIKRLEQGVIEEVKEFEKKYPNNKLQSKATLGYQEIIKFINQKISKEELIDLWTLSESQYARRQNTWWKKINNIEWFEASKISIENILNRVFLA